MNEEKLRTIVGKIFWGTFQTLEVFFKFFLFTILVVCLSEAIFYFNILTDTTYKVFITLFVLGGYYWTFKNPLIRFRNYFMRARE